MVVIGFVLSKLFVFWDMTPDSLIQLIATPKKYHNKTVTVDGFLQIEFEGNALYLHKEDAQFLMTANGLWVELSDEMKNHPDKYHNKHVFIEGNFNAKSHGHLGLFSGTIENITRIHLLEDYSEQAPSLYREPAPRSGQSTSRSE